MSKKLIIKIVADSNEAVKETKQLTSEIKKLDRAVDKVGDGGKGIAKVSKGFKSLSGTVKGLVASFAAIGIAMKAMDMAKMGADAEQSADAFEKVMTDMGKSAEDEFTKIKEASMGLIPDAAIQQAAVTAASLGVPVEKLGGLMEVARAKSREMGTTVEQAFNDLATGIGRGSPMILDNLGLTIKLGEAYETMAKSLGKTTEELTKEEKTLALTNQVLDAGADSINRFADAGLSANEQFQQMNAELDNLQVQIGQALLPHLVELSKATSDWLKNLDPNTVREFTGAISGIFKGIIGIGKALLWINDVILPDSIFGDNAGLLDTVALGWAKIGRVIDGTAESTKKLAQIDPFEKFDSSSTEAITKVKEEIDTLHKKIADLKTLTINGITLIVDADTTPASFMVEKFQRTYEEGKMVLSLSADYLEAEQQIKTLQNNVEQKDIKLPFRVDTKEAEKDTQKVKDDIGKKPAKLKVEADTKKVPAEVQKMKDRIGSVPVMVNVDANTKPAEAKIKKVEAPSDSIHTVDANTSAAQAAINKLKVPTSSIHTVYMKTVETRSGGGQIPQRLASGGVFTGSGRVGGYDPTDSDRVNAKLTGGEFVIKRSAVDHYGASLLRDINNISVPKFASGGHNAAAETVQPITQPITLNIAGKTFQVMSDAEVAEALERHINQEGGL